MGRRWFEHRYQIDFRELIAELNERPIIKIEAYAFVGYFQGERFVLGPVDSQDIRPTVHRMVGLAQEAHLQRMLAREYV